MSQPLFYEAEWIGPVAFISEMEPSAPLGLKSRRPKRSEVVSLGDGVSLSLSLLRGLWRKPHA